MARDTMRIGGKAGVRAADEVLALAHSPAEVARAARLADRFGPATRATVKLLGRGAIVLTKVLTELVGWIFAALGWAFAAASAAAAFGRWLARATRRRGTEGRVRSRAYAPRGAGLVNRRPRAIGIGLAGAPSSQYPGPIGVGPARGHGPSRRPAGSSIHSRRAMD